MVEFGESQAVGAINQDGVTERDIEAVLNNGRRDQDVRFMMHKLEHHFFKLAFGHLPVSDDDARSRHKLLQFGGNVPDRIHAVVDEVDLPVTI